MIELRIYVLILSRVDEIFVGNVFYLSFVISVSVIIQNPTINAYGTYKPAKILE